MREEGGGEDCGRAEKQEPNLGRGEQLLSSDFPNTGNDPEV